MNYFPFHLGDYSAHTGHLDLLEDLAYRRCLDAYYLREGPLPKDASEVARIIRMRDHAATVRDVLNEFFQLGEDGWRHARCDQEIEKMQDKQAKARASAQASVNARKANAERSLNVRSTNVELPTPTPTPTPVFEAPPVGKAKAKRLSPDWQLPKPWGEWALDAMTWDAATVRLEAEKFKDYWTAKSGKDATKLDWEATWRNWCRSARPTKQSFAQQAADIARTTVPPAHTGPDPALLKIEADLKKAAPMPEHIRQQINQVLRKA